jgi:threonine dehydrogenase-like Zn-dependent dehydrogenase
VLGRVIAAGDTVAILGSGHLGLAPVVAAQFNGAARVAVTGTSEDALRLEAARRLGAELTVNIGEHDPVGRCWR